MAAPAHRYRSLSWLALAGAVVVFGAFVGAVGLRLETALGWIAVGIAGLGALAGVLAWRHRAWSQRSSDVPLRRGGLIAAIASNAILASIFVLYLTVLSALPGHDLRFPPGTPFAPATTAVLTNHRGDSVAMNALGSRPTVVVFYRGHW